jgi:hypothetical protein
MIVYTDRVATKRGVPRNAKMKKLPLRFWEKSPQQRMHSLFNRYLNGVLAAASLVALISLLTATAIPAQPSSTVPRKFVLHTDLGGQGARPATIICVDDNPASLSGVKAGQLLSTVSQEVWQGEGKSFRLVIRGTANCRRQ